MTHEHEFEHAYEHDELDLLLEPALADHPDVHDGWGAIRPRQIECTSERSEELVAHEHTEQERVHDASILVTDVDPARLKALLRTLTPQGAASELERLRAEVTKRVAASESMSGAVTIRLELAPPDARRRRLERDT